MGSIVAAPRIAGMDSKKEYLAIRSVSMPVNIPVAIVAPLLDMLEILRSLGRFLSVKRQLAQAFCDRFSERRLSE
jgi:hypothetical protein